MYLTPFEKRQKRIRKWRLLGQLLLGFVVLTLLDPILARLLFNPDRDYLNSKDLYTTARVVGALWIWIAITFALFFHDRVWDRAGSVFLAPVLAGLFAELLKRIMPRERPVDGDGLQQGWYHWREFMSGFAESTNLGMPSSHTAVAFAGCLVLAAWMPRARSVLLVLAIGCGISRMLTGAHFATDVYIGALIGWACARFFEPPPPAPIRFG